MAHPKRKTSKTRRDKRRTHYKSEVKNLAICPVTGESHRPHRAFWFEDKLYLNGKIMMKRDKSNL